MIFAALMNRQVFYTSFGFGQEKPVLIGLMIILQFIFAPYNELISFLMTALCRQFEFQADQFATQQSSAEQLVSALVKLVDDNASTLTPDPIHSAFYDSHPPASIRIRHLLAS